MNAINTINEMESTLLTAPTSITSSSSSAAVVAAEAIAISETESTTIPYNENHHVTSTSTTTTTLPSTTQTIVVTEDERNGTVGIMKQHQKHNHRRRRLISEQQLQLQEQEHQLDNDNSNYGLHHINQVNNNHTNHKSAKNATTTTTTTAATVQLTEQDVVLCQLLDMEYERAIEERTIVWNARYQSVRQSTVVSIVFMILLIGTGTIFFVHQAAADGTYWSIPEGLFFSIYTITTVGYGHLDMPDTNVFQWYTIIYIFVGIAMLTILVAQIYQCVALETSRVAVHANDTSSARKTSKMRRWLQQEQERRSHLTSTSNHTHQQQQNQQNRPTDTSTTTNVSVDPNTTTPSNLYNMDTSATTIDWVDVVTYMLQIFDTTVSFLRENEYGRSISVLLPFAVLITIGAVVIGPIEGWTATESIYFSVVSLTTVGFGDYYPTKNASIWFCCIWLPFSVGFMSLYLGNVAAFYIRLSDRNIARIENVLRKRIQSIKLQAQIERQSVLRRALRGQQGNNNNKFRRSNSNDESIDRYSNDSSMDDENSLISETINEESIIASIQARNHNSHIRRMNSSKRFFGFNILPTADIDDVDSVNNTYNDTNHHNGSRDNSIHSDTTTTTIPRNSNRGMNNSIFNNNRTNTMSSPNSTSHRRDRIIRNSMRHMEITRSNSIDSSTRLDNVPLDQGTVTSSSNRKMTMTTMKDVLRSVHQNNMIQQQRLRSDVGNNNNDNTTTTNTIPSTEVAIGTMSLSDADTTKSIPNNSTDETDTTNTTQRQQFQSYGPESEYLSVRSNRTLYQHDSKTVRKKPSFALRALIQERIAEIIAIDVAGYHNSIEIKDCTLIISIDILKKVCEKWYIPRRARRAFRAVAFEALYFVGEHGLITRGAEALYSLSPIEFHQIFSPLLAAFGDAETMESWLEYTQPLADVDLVPTTNTNTTTLSSPRQLTKSYVTNTNDNISIRRTSEQDSSGHDRQRHSLPVTTVTVPSSSLIPSSAGDDLPEIA